MIETGSIKRRNFMTVGMRCGIALLAGPAAFAGTPAKRPCLPECSVTRRLVLEYGAEFGGTAVFGED